MQMKLCVSLQARLLVLVCFYPFVHWNYFAFSDHFILLHLFVWRIITGSSATLEKLINVMESTCVIEHTHNGFAGRFVSLLLCVCMQLCALLFGFIAAQGDAAFLHRRHMETWSSKN